MVDRQFRVPSPNALVVADFTYVKLVTGVFVYVAFVIDAYAGALGTLGGFAGEPDELNRHLALIAGTSSCVMAMSPVERPFGGGWGPCRRERAVAPTSGTTVRNAAIK